MSSTVLLENYLSVVQEHGINTAKNCTFSGTNTFSGANTFSGTNSFSGTVAFTGATSITATSSSTSGSSSVEPFTVSETMTGVGGVGGRSKFSLTTNVALGSWSNALKGEVTYGASGSTSGLGSAIVGEMTLSAGTSAGTYAPFEAELNLGTGASTGTHTSMGYFSVNGADAATFSTAAGTSILNIQGLTAGASNVFRTGLTGATVVGNMTAALRIKVGSTTYFIPLATATT